MSLRTDIFFSSDLDIEFGRLYLTDKKWIYMLITCCEIEIATIQFSEGQLFGSIID